VLKASFRQPATDVYYQASGTLGSKVLERLLPDNSFEVTVLARPESKAQFGENVNVLRPEQTHVNLVNAFAGQNAVICTTSIAAIPEQKALIDAAVEAKVQRFILNEFANPLTYGGLPDLQWTRERKLEVLQYARAKAAEHKTFTWTGIATGHFLDYALTRIHAFGFNIPARAARIVDDGSEPFSATTTADIATALVGVLKHPAETANQYLNIRSTDTTQAHILAALESQTGCRFSVEHVQSGDLLASGREKIAKGDRSGMLDLVVAQLCERGAGRAKGHWDDNANHLLGVREKTADEIVSEVLTAMQ
jgi:uncharacterized protein YbjT (DUF2867 family)